MKEVISIATFILSIILLLSGCTSATGNSPLNAIPATKGIVEEMIPSAAATKWLTIPSEESRVTENTINIPSTITPPQPTLKPRVPMCKGRGEVQPVPGDFGIHGALVYYPFDYYENTSVVGGVPLQWNKLPLDKDKRYEVLGFSPDGKWLAHIYLPEGAFEPTFDRSFRWTEFEVTLLSDDGQTIHHSIDIEQFVLEYPSDARPEGPLENRWVNNQMIYTNLGATTEDPQPDGRYFITRPKMFDPFVGQWNESLVSNLSDIKVEVISISPDLSRMAYLVRPNQLVLWDINNQEMIWNDDSFSSSSIYKILEWAPDGSALFISNGVTPISSRQVSLMDKDGQSQEIADGDYPVHDFSPSRAVWSPNSQFIAIADGDEELFIFDTAKNMFLVRCPISDPDAIVWSPDNQYLAVGSEFSALRLFNIQTGEIIELSKFGIPVGWSATFPVSWP